MCSSPRFAGASISAGNDRGIHRRSLKPPRSKRYFLLPENRTAGKRTTSSLGRNSGGERMYPAELGVRRWIGEFATCGNKTPFGANPPRFLLPAGDRHPPAPTIFASFR